MGNIFKSQGLLAGAPADMHSGIRNPILNSDLQDILLNRSPVEFFQIFLQKLVGIGLIIGVLIFFFMLIVGAIQWIASGGDKTALEGARGRITNAIIGIVILLSVFAIIKIVESFFGIKILTIDIGVLVI